MVGDGQELNDMRDSKFVLLLGATLFVFGVVLAAIFWGILPPPT